MFKIVRIPPKIKSFFDPLQNQFHFNHFEYFQTLVLLMAFCWGRRNIATLYRHLDSCHRTHRSRFNNFLNVGRCNYQVTLQLKACELLSNLRPVKGQTVELILDDSKSQKRGKAIQAVGWIRDQLTGRNIRGHQYVTAVIRFRGHTIPFGIRLYVKKEDCKGLGIEFKKTTQLAAELISEFKPPEGVHVRVLFDSFYLCPVVVKSCRKSGFHFVWQSRCCLPAVPRYNEVSSNHLSPSPRYVRAAPSRTSWPSSQPAWRMPRSVWAQRMSGILLQVFFL